jgi:predicted ATPase/DNA-binding CsgD family transcriptional regulator/transcriptional regulator with XRE-family HTH domain
MASHQPVVIAEFGETLRRLRFAAGMTQRDLALRSGLSTRGISDLERGARLAPRAETVELLGGALGLDSRARAELAHAARVRPRNRLGRSALFRRWPGLPASPNALVGRETEIAAIAGLVLAGGARCITLAGPAGVGKTRLAIAAGARLRPAPETADGVAFVSLASIADPGLLMPTIAGAFGLQMRGREADATLLRESIGEKSLLLVLDNFEHIASASPQVAELQEHCPNLIVLITSRTILRLSSERVFAVPPLGLPDLHAESSVAAALESEAVCLFIQRAKAVNPEFQLHPGNLAAVVAICRRLDGLPLALELAAARTGILDPGALLRRLERRTAALGQGPRDAPARQRTLHTAIAWSYDLLEPAQQDLFCRLSAFSGGFTLEAAEAMASQDHHVDTLDLIGALVDQSLVYRRLSTMGVPRFGMLESIRDFGLDQLNLRADRDTVWNQLCDYVLSVADAMRAQIDGPDSAAALRTLDVEHANCRTALAAAINENRVETALRLTGLLWKFWLVRGHLREGRSWAGQTLELTGGSSLARFWAWYGAAALALAQHDFPSTFLFSDQIAAVARQTGVPVHEGLALLPKAVAFHDSGDHKTATDLFETALSSFLGLERECRRARYSAAFAMTYLGSIAAAQGRPDEAIARIDTAMARWRELGDTWGTGIALMNLANIARTTSRYEEARRIYWEGFRCFEELEDRPRMIGCIEQLASLETDSGQDRRAARLLGAADTLREAVMIPRLPAEAEERARIVSKLSGRLGLADFAADYELGKTGTLAEAELRTTDINGGPRTDHPGSTRRDAGASNALTRREVEVLRLVADGRKDREIADVLYLSSRTVASHLTSIFNKLGVDSRTAAAVHAIRQGLL